MSEPGFTLLPDSPVPFQPRLDQNAILPAAAPPDKLSTEWQPYPDAILSLFGGNVVFGGATPAVTDGVTRNADFYLGDASVDSRYIKQGGLVQVYVRFTIGQTTVINALAENAAGEIQGALGIMGINLPFPAAAIQPYALGQVVATATTQDATNALHHLAAATNDIWTQPLDAGANLIYFLSSPVWVFTPKAPAVYNANGFEYWSPGDYLEVLFEYETDYDG